MRKIVIARAEMGCCHGVCSEEQQYTHGNSQSTEQHQSLWTWTVPETLAYVSYMAFSHQAAVALHNSDTF